MKVKHFALAIIAGVIILKTWSVLYGTADKALWTNQFAVNNVENPEGWLWQVINPIQFGQFGYRLWCFNVDMFMLAIQLKIKRIPKMYLAFSQVISSYAYVGWGHEYQDVTIIALMPFIILSSAFAILSLAQKLPLWFDWNNLKDHAQCIFTCSPVHGLGNFSTYSMLAFCFLAPFIVKMNLDRWLRIDNEQIRWKS